MGVIPHAPQHPLMMQRRCGTQGPHVPEIAIPQGPVFAQQRCTLQRARDDALMAVSTMSGAARYTQRMTLLRRPTLLLAIAALAACGKREAEPPPDPMIFLREGPDRLDPPKLVAPLAPGFFRPRINDAGLAIIEESEGLRLEAYALAGQWLIGYGHAGTAREGMTITAERAETLLLGDLARTERELAALLGDIQLNDNEWSAVVSLAYNLGVGGFSRTLAYERLAEGDRLGAADAFLYLDSAVFDGERRESPHLKERRERERELFLTPLGDAPHIAAE